MHITPGQQPPVGIPEGGLTEEKIEYRDEDGNLLDDEQVKALEGKVSFSTRYETRTRLVDEDGNEVYQGEDEAGVAGTSPDGVDPMSGNDAGEGEASTLPGKVGVKEDLAKERRVVEERMTAEPESEVGKVTRDEL